MLPWMPSGEAFQTQRYRPDESLDTICLDELRARPMDMVS
ncbi:hypothetical protein PT974_12051 [Cladobotryum mycophilum]|uniref:Uncharacterized protein n=1 Tax=Cladobotryum mycophilum TaxID=491253 RepID=A0ABR0S809_9HYPO